MITYTLWKTLREKGISQNKLIHQFGFSSGELDRIRKNQYISTHTVDVLCTILECPVGDIIEFQMDAVFRPELGMIPGKTLLTSLPNALPDNTKLSSPANLESTFSEAALPEAEQTKAGQAETGQAETRQAETGQPDAFIKTCGGER